MEATEKPRHVVVVLHVVAASVLFYLGVAMMLMSPEGDPHESLVEAALPLLIFTIPALLITGRIAWLLRRAESAQSTARPLWLNVPISIGAVVIGAVLISLAIWREHWVALFWRR